MASVHGHGGTGRRTGWIGRATARATARIPSRDELLASRVLKPFARQLSHPSIWHFNRRGVARGAALGLFFGIVVPLMQTPVAAALALPARANLPVAAFATFVTNPFTTPLIYFAAFQTGRAILRFKESGGELIGADVSWFERAITWLAGAAAPTALGLLLFGTVASILGYVGVQMGWRLWIGRKLRRRRARRARAAAVG